MKKVFFILVSVLAISLSACGQAGKTEAVPTVVLDAGASSQPVNNQPSSNSSCFCLGDRGASSGCEFILYQHRACDRSQRAGRG